MKISVVFQTANIRLNPWITIFFFREPNKENENIDYSALVAFLEEIRADYQEGGPQF